MYKDKDGTIRFEETDNKEEFNKQLEDFSKEADSGKIICLTDLIINAETQHMKNIEKEE